MERKRAMGPCLCGMRPGFVNCTEEIAYCRAEQGTSGCIKQEQRRLCPGCPVHEEENFQHVCYRIHGSGRDRSRSR